MALPYRIQLAMRLIRFPAHRIPNIRPLRPPNTVQTRFLMGKAEPNSRIHDAPRVQLPFLSSPRVFRNGGKSTRPVSTERRQMLNYRMRLTLYWVSIGTVLVIGGIMSHWVVRQDWLDRLYPSPDEWSFKTKVDWREGQEELSKEKMGSAMVNWGGVGTYFRRVIAACENEGAKEGLAVLPNADLDETIPGIDKELIKRQPLSEVNKYSRIGMDVSGKPEHWKRAYFRALMGFAKAAEMNDGWVVDVTRSMVFPQNQVIGPSNPHPHPTWPGSPPAPREENCEPCFDNPSTQYIRILTTNGLSTKQRLEAGLAYAAWADYEGNQELAMQLHQWSLNLACSALAKEDTKPESIVNARTGIIKSDAPFVTPNILKVTTALAAHHARGQNLSTALNIYISILRARRAAPDAPSNQQYKPKGPDYSLETYDSIMQFISSLTTKPQMAPEPPSGNEPFTRTQGSNCNEAGVMVHVGEILYATSSKRAGLSWTRDGVALAEMGYNDARLDNESKVSCGDCMSAGLENWHRMLGVLVTEEKKKDEGKDASGWAAWVPSFSKTEVSKLVDEGDWKAEAELVEKKRALFLEHRLMHSMSRKADRIPME